MEKLLHNVADLTEPARSAVEGLMGHALRDDQQVYIVALDSASAPPAQQRHDAWSELQEIIVDMHDSVRQSGIASDLLERTIDETCDQVRYGK